MKTGNHIAVWACLCGLILCVACSTRADREAQACYERGKQLREEGEPVLAMKAFLRAAQSGTQDEALLGRVYSNIANLCRQADDHEAAFRIYTVSAGHFRVAQDTLAYFKKKQYLCSIKNKLKNAVFK